MQYFVIEPEVAGGWGPNTRYHRKEGKPTVVEYLHYELQGWLGDKLLATSPCFIVTKELADDISRSNLTGVEFDDAEVSTSDAYKELDPNQVIPEFVRLNPTGTPLVTDFASTEGNKLIVSKRALDVLQRAGLQHANVIDYEPTR